MGAQGSMVFDFGSALRTTTATQSVTGEASILAGSLVEAFLMPAATADHSVDEHVMEDLTFAVVAVTAGVGFTVRGVCRLGHTWGRFTVGWVWN